MSLKCLVVDDAGFIREIISHAILSNGDVIFLDLVLPKFNGIEIARWVRENSPSTKIIAVSTLDDEVTMAQSFEAGAQIYIRKPFKQSEIKEALNKIRKNEVITNV